MWLSRSYEGDATARQALSSDGLVAVTPDEGGYLFDGPGESTALVFLPGAKVQSEAYAPLMHDLAVSFAAPSLEDTVGHLSYDHLMMAGHSMGGVVAASHVAEHPESADALVLLASYPSSKIPEGIALLSIYGTEDTVLNPDAYDEARSLWPPDAQQLVIAGGNHAGFGSYGRQSRDGEALISQGEQRKQTVTAIVRLANNIEEDS
jgi:pimeloyl-ACP methyl ester carboxylesterase